MIGHSLFDILRFIAAIGQFPGSRPRDVDMRLASTAIAESAMTSELSDNPYESPRSPSPFASNVPVWRLIACSVYVCLPAVSGLVSIVALAAGHWQAGLVAGALCGGVIGIPLAIVQLMAVIRRNVSAAGMMAVAFAFFSVGMIPGLVFNLAVVLGLASDGDYLDSPTSWAIMLGILGMNVFTWFTMWNHAKALKCR